MATKLNFDYVRDYDRRVKNGIIAVDFDGTITLPSPYPITGSIRPECIDVLKKLKEKYLLVLWTARDDEDLIEAENLCLENGIEFDHINCCPRDRGGRKIRADIFIDDKNFNSSINWKQIENKLLGEKV